jgi:hypothetical protein
MTDFEKKLNLFQEEMRNHRVQSPEKQHWQIGLAAPDAIFKIQTSFSNPQEARQAIDKLIAAAPDKLSRGKDYDENSPLVYARLRL